MDKELSIDGWRARAKSRIPNFLFDYLEGGAELEISLRRNREALDQIFIVPDRLQDVRECDISTSIFGKKYETPLVVAPLGYSGIFWPNGDELIAKASNRLAVPFTLSTASTSSISDIANLNFGNRWFQLYVLQNRKITEHLLSKAIAHEYDVLVITVDVPINGFRLRDIRNKFSLPLRFNRSNFLDSVLHPNWFFQFLKHGLPRLANLSDLASQDEASLTSLARREMDRGFTWEALRWIRSIWKKPIILKGILSVRDAELARDYGMDGIVVSNHGGRQLGCAPASTDVLGDIAAAVGNDLDVLVDGGFMYGPDVVKAIALGARAVLIGRPVLYGLAADGEEGVHSILNHVMGELKRTMTLMGLSKLSSLSRRHLYKP